MPQQFLTYQQQVAKLTGKGLQIQDIDEAQEALCQIGYFALINGYRRPFVDPSTRRFINGASFADIKALYEFDSDLRDLFFRYITKVEIRMRNLLTEVFCSAYGVSQNAYLTMGNYSGDRHCARSVVHDFSCIANAPINNRTKEYVRYHKLTYGNLPLWVLLNASTFGQVSKMYSALGQSMRMAIAKNFDAVNERQLEQYLKVLNKFRNVCAHNERLYCHREHIDIPDTRLHRKLQIPKRGQQYVYGKRDLFAVVIALRHLLPKDEFRAFKRKLCSLIRKRMQGQGAGWATVVLGEMGFPQNWKAITRYKLRVASES